MAEKPPKKDPPKVEERWVKWSDLEAGVHIKKAGHPVILFIGGQAPPGTETTDDPDSTTTAGPGTTTSAAPGSSTTAAPDATTTAPGASTTAAPAATTSAPPATTSTPPATTSGAPSTTTSAAPSTTTSASPSTTTSASPSTTTSAAPSTTTSAAPSTTTSAAPSTTTSAAPSTTTSAAPSTTTTAAASTTTTAAPSTTTTKAPSTTTTTTPSTTTTAAPSTTTTAAHSTTTTAAPTTTTTAAPTTTTTAAPTTTTTLGKTTRKTAFGGEHFETAKSFPLPLPGAIETFQKIAALSNKETGRQLLILGHTDTQASDDYNMTLSNERALSIRAYLLNDVATWFAWYDNDDQQKQWGVREDQYMLSALPYGGDPFFAGTVSSQASAAYTAAVKKFQASASLDADGIAGPDTRKALILQFMQAEGTSVPSGTTIETKGCGFRNLAVQTGPNVANQANRRTEVYAFVGAITPDASAWDNDNPGTYKTWNDSVLGDFE